MAQSVCWHLNYAKRKTQLLLAPKVEKAVGDAQQESQIIDFLVNIYSY